MRDKLIDEYLGMDIENQLYCPLPRLESGRYFLRKACGL